jgi:dihydroxyacetone kinase-like predicted kinase
MNPSTEDILRAINSINAKEIVILPNNSNIILAANQAKSISEKNVHVIKSKTISHGIASMIGFNHNESIENNVEIMSEIIEDMDTIQVTYSVRDTVFNDQDIKKDDILAVVNGEIKSVGKEINPTVLEALEGSIDDDKEIITLYYGSEVSEEEAEELSNLIEEKFEDLEVEIYYGGQPLYYYLMSIE